jgi:hypothetical protein
MKPSSTHYHFIRELWRMAGKLGLRQRRMIQQTKNLIDAFKVLPFDRRDFI